MNSAKMIYTPKDHIPVGEAVKMPDGTHALRVKNPRTKGFDDISLDTLLEALVQQAKQVQNAETRTTQGLAAQNN